MEDRYNPIKEWFEKVRKRIHWKEMLIPFVVIALIITAIVLLSLNRPKVDLLQDSTIKQIISRSRLIVGVRNNIELFSIEQNGIYEGMEDDLARSIAKKLYGTEQNVEFVSVDSTTRKIKLRTEEVDCVIAISPTGFDDEFVYSKPYFTDAVALIVRPGEKIDGLEDLQHKKIGAIQKSGDPKHHGAYTIAQNVVASLPEINASVQSYSALDELFEALAKNQIQAIAIENALLVEYYNPKDMQVLPDAIGKVPYSIAFRKENDVLRQVVDELLSQMKEDGRLQALWDKWGLRDYSKD